MQKKSVDSLFPRLRVELQRLTPVLLGLFLALGVPVLAQARTYTITDYIDDNVINGTCTLREAIRASNMNVAIDGCGAGHSTFADRIQLAAGTHVVDLTTGFDENNGVTGDLDIAGSVVIEGPSSEFAIIDGTGPGTNDRLFHILNVNSVVEIRGVTLRGGDAQDVTGRGGVLRNQSNDSVELIDVEISGGRAATGAGIYNEGDLTIRRSRINGNVTITSPGNDSHHGGGIFSSSNSDLRIEDTEISNNQADDGAGIWSAATGFVLYRSVVQDNVARRDGGGVHVSAFGFEIDYVDLSRNSAARGGGVYIGNMGEIQHSALVANSASIAGGAVFDGFGGFARFSTMTQNTAPMGAGVYSDSAMTLLDSNTIAHNNGSGLHNQAGAFFENTLIAFNTGSNCSGAAPAFGAFNMEDANSCGFVTGVDTPNFPNTDPLLDTLKDNGGPTRSMALLPGSPAIDVVTSEIRMNCEQMLDQRGHPRGRPRIENAAGEDVFLCDLGAYERTTPILVDSLADAVDADLTDDVCATAGGLCSLRAAVQQAGAIPGMIEIDLGAGTHLLSIGGDGEDASISGDLDITPPLRIRGAGATLTTIDADSLDRVFDVAPVTVPVGNAPITTFFEDLQITGGDAGNSNGGGILALRDIRLDRVLMSGNDAQRGSGINAWLPFSSTDTARVEIVDSTISQNAGGGAVVVRDAWIERSSLIDNAASVSINGGAGEFIQVHLKNSTVSGNSASATGAIFASQAILDNSTIVNNTGSGSSDPGGLFLLELSVFRNTIIANNTNASGLRNCALNPGAVISVGFNLTDGDSTDCNLSDPTDQVAVDPQLGLLANNGGPTLTHLPLSGSAAIDMGDVANCPALDQRSVARPLDGDSNGSVVCDVGAVEVPEPGLGGLIVAGIGWLVCIGRRRTACQV